LFKQFLKISSKTRNLQTTTTRLNISRKFLKLNLFTNLGVKYTKEQSKKNISSIFFVFWAVSFLDSYIAVKFKFFFKISPSHSLFMIFIQRASAAREIEKIFI